MNWRCSLTFVLVFVLPLECGWTLMQSPSESDRGLECTISELTIAEGIPIPGLEVARIKSRLVPWGPPNSEGIQSRHLILSKSYGRMPVVKCEAGKFGRVSLRFQRVAVEEIKELGRAGRVFGLLVRAVWLGSDNPPSRLGAMSILYLYDSTGSGLIDTVVNASKIGFHVRIPDWLKEPI